MTLNVVANTIEPIPLAPGYGILGYDLPVVGSYKLPSLDTAADGQVLDENGNRQSLHSLFKGKYSLLSFIYSNCSDVNGCPLTANVFYKIKSQMSNDKVLADNLQLMSLSFDPERDTPAVMSLYRENFKYAGDKGDWRFLTTDSLASLNPILEEYHQDVQRTLSVDGSENGDISHILRVFLVDPDFNIRNIYSVGFLHKSLLINDVKTLMLDANSKPQEANNVDVIPVSLLSKAGDDKEGYGKTSYQTRSKSLTARPDKGKQTDLLAIANNPPLGLPMLPVDILKNLSAEKIELGRKLFFDRRLSLNNTFSCAMCHVPEQGFTSNEISMAVGIEGRSVRRNSPTVYNIAYTTRLFHDGREHSLDQQIWGPLLAKNEMGNPSVGAVIQKIQKIDDYKSTFKKVYPRQGINMLSLGDAFASYQRTLLSANSPFDRWYFAHERNAISESAQKGFKLFTGKGKCSSCHSVNEKFALFTDNQMHNTGIGYIKSMGVKPEKQRIVIAPGVFIDADTSAIESVGEPEPSDLGLYEITENPADRWKYKTPSLRNISLTAPYMHDGSLGSLKEVVAFYNQGGIQNEVLSPLVTPLNLSLEEEGNLVAFLEALTGSNVDELVADAFAAPVGDTVNLEHSD